MLITSASKKRIAATQLPFKRTLGVKAQMKKFFVSLFTLSLASVYCFGSDAISISNDEALEIAKQACMNCGAATVELDGNKYFINFAGPD